MKPGMMQRGKNMKRVLFVCTGNTCRSPMAELIFNKKARENSVDAYAQSAGLCTIEGLLINDNSKEALSELGIQSDFFRSTDIYDLELEDFDLVAGMTKEHTQELEKMISDPKKVVMLNQNSGGIKDPYGGSLEVYKICRDEIDNSLKEIFEKL